MTFSLVGDILTKLALAAALGGLVGWQRERRDRPAGLRTHMLVSLGAAMYALAGLGFGKQADPSRIAAQVATGVGFLGAGTIMRYGGGVLGLTTVASLWAVAAIGICASIGGNAYWIALFGAGLVLLTLTLFQRVETRFLAHNHAVSVTVALAGTAERLRELRQELSDRQVPVDSVQVITTPEGTSELQLTIRMQPGADVPDLMCYLSSLPGFRSMWCPTRN